MTISDSYDSGFDEDVPTPTNLARNHLPRIHPKFFGDENTLINLW